MSVLPRLASCSWSLFSSATNRTASLATRSFSLYFNTGPMPTGGCNALAQASGSSLLCPPSLSGPSSAVSVPAMMQVRHKPRDYWPFPKEWKRINKYGFDEKRAIVKGRRIILKKILKGSSVLGH